MGAPDLHRWLTSVDGALKPHQIGEPQAGNMVSSKPPGSARRVVGSAPPQTDHIADARSFWGVGTESMVQRIALFTRRGLEHDLAVLLAERCAARDDDLLAPSPARPGGTGMAACMECEHMGRAGGDRYRCGNWRELDMGRGQALLAMRFVVEFHRCNGFAYASNPASSTSESVRSAASSLR